MRRFLRMAHDLIDLCSNFKLIRFNEAVFQAHLGCVEKIEIVQNFKSLGTIHRVINNNNLNFTSQLLDVQIFSPNPRPPLKTSFFPNRQIKGTTLLCLKNRRSLNNEPLAHLAFWEIGFKMGSPN